MKNKKILSVKINDSLNPMHYIRDDEDIQIYINNLLTSFPEKDTVTKPVVQLLYIILQYIIYTTVPKEWTTDNINRFLETIELKPDGSYGPFGIIFGDLSTKTEEKEQSTYRNYVLFKNLCETDKTIELEKVIETTRKLAVEHAERTSATSLTQYLKKPQIPLQATVTTTGPTYCFYFKETYGKDIQVYGLKQNKEENTISAGISAIHPFLYDFAEEPTLSEQFLQRAIGLCDEALKKQNVNLAWVIENAFKDDFEDDLDTINEYDPNEAYKRRKKQLDGNHEAGHAVLSWLANWDVDHATIRATEDAAGYVLSKPANLTSGLFEKTVVDMMTSYAGYIAERQTNPTVIKWKRREATQDVKDATKTAKKYINECVCTLDQSFVDYQSLGVSETFWVAYKTSLLCEYVYNRTAEIVNANRDLIDALAAQLYEKKTMTGAEIDACLSAIDQSRKGSLLAIIREEEKTINTLLNPYLSKENETKEEQQLC